MSFAEPHLFFKIQTLAQNIATIESLQYIAPPVLAVSSYRFCELYNNAPENSELELIKRRWMHRKATALPLCLYTLALGITQVFLGVLIRPFCSTKYFGFAYRNFMYSQAYLSNVFSDSIGLYNLESLRFDDLREDTREAYARRQALVDFVINPVFYPPDLSLDETSLLYLRRLVRDEHLFYRLPGNALRLLCKIFTCYDYERIPISRINDLDFSKLNESHFQSLSTVRAYVYTNNAKSEVIKALNISNLTVCINRKLIQPHQANCLTTNQLQTLNVEALDSSSLGYLLTNTSSDFFLHLFVFSHLGDHRDKALGVFKYLLKHRLIFESDLIDLFIESLGVRTLEQLNLLELQTLGYRISPDQLNRVLIHFQTLRFSGSWTKEHVKQILRFPSFDVSGTRFHGIDLTERLIDYLINNNICSPKEFFNNLSTQQKRLACVQNHPSLRPFFPSNSYTSEPGSEGARTRSGGAAEGAGYSYSSPGAGGAAGGAGASRAPSGPSLIGESYLDAIIKKTDSSPKTTLDALRLLCPVLYTKYKGAEIFTLSAEEARRLRSDTLALQRKYHTDKIRRLPGDTDETFTKRVEVMSACIKVINAAADIIKESGILA